ncbi:MAG: class I SAM-dependent methyltransferase [Lachnospiraceae bacterium]
MKEMREHKNFWDKNAGRYDRFMRKDRAAYDEMYVLIRPVVKAKTVLELATGTGLIAKHIVNAAAHIEATDASAEMIAEAKRDNRSAKLYFSVQDMFCLPYAEESFDVVIVSNALHIVPQPEKALAGDPPGAEGRRCAHRAHLYPCGKLVFRQGQGIFYEACGLSPPQQVDERRIPRFLKSEWLDGAEKRCSEGILPADLCGMCEIGGVIRCHFLRTPESLWGLAGKSWSP